MYRQTNLTEFARREDFTFAYGDVSDKDLLKTRVRANDVVIPLAAIVGMPASKKYPNETVEMNQEAIESI